MKSQKIVRSAKTGRFSKTGKAKSAPATHVTETIKSKPKKKKRPRSKKYGIWEG